MAEAIVKRQKSLKQLERRLESKEQPPPNSQHFDVRNSASKSRISLKSEIKSGHGKTPSLNQRSTRTLYNNPSQKLLSKDEYEQKLKSQFEQAQSKLLNHSMFL